MAERTPEDFEAAPIDAAGYVDFGAVKQMTEAERMQAAFDRITHRRMMHAARQMSARKHRQEPNCSFAMSLFGLGSTYAWHLCLRMGIDPDATTLTPWSTEEPSR